MLAPTVTSSQMHAYDRLRWSMSKTYRKGYKFCPNAVAVLGITGAFKLFETCYKFILEYFYANAFGFQNIFEKLGFFPFWWQQRRWAPSRRGPHFGH